MARGGCAGTGGGGWHPAVFCSQRGRPRPRSRRKGDAARVTPGLVQDTDTLLSPCPRPRTPPEQGGGVGGQDSGSSGRTGGLEPPLPRSVRWARGQGRAPHHWGSLLQELGSGSVQLLRHGGVSAGGALGQDEVHLRFVLVLDGGIGRLVQVPVAEQGSWGRCGDRRGAAAPATVPPPLGDTSPSKGRHPAQPSAAREQGSGCPPPHMLLGVSLP